MTMNSTTPKGKRGEFLNMKRSTKQNNNRSGISVYFNGGLTSAQMYCCCCRWTLIWLLRPWAWLGRGYWRNRSLIDWLTSGTNLHVTAHNTVRYSVHHCHSTIKHTAVALSIALKKCVALLACNSKGKSHILIWWRFYRRTFWYSFTT